MPIFISNSAVFLNNPNSNFFVKSLQLYCTAAYICGKNYLLLLLRWLAIWCMLAVLNQSLNRVWIWVSFQMNRDYIAAYLCENKDRPEMKCGGKCYLMKQMAAAEQQDAEIPPLKHHFEVTFFVPASAVDIQLEKLFDSTLSILFFPHVIGVVADSSNSIDHPPRA